MGSFGYGKVYITTTIHWVGLVIKKSFMRYIRIVFLLLSFIYNENLQADEYAISGYVKDKNNGNPLIGANIFIEGTSIGVAADKNGYYEIDNIERGNYTFKVSYIGYKTTSEMVELMSNQKKYILDFNLNYTTIEGKEITVTAQAKGQMDAINRQLNSKSLVNIISSDRIQELPDANAAETVARVPGVSIQREGGEGNKVIIRGLSPKYNNVTVNGVKLASTDNDDRSTDISMISQYMLEGIEVTKSGTPDQDADVLGGTVNFQLKKAQPGFNGNIIIQGMHNGLKNTYNDYKLVLDLSRRFWNDRIGILGQIDNENRNRSSNEIGTSYNLYGETLDTINPLQLQSLNLNDWIRLNDRQNTLQVFDINIPNGNISYSNLNSNIDKDITRYSISYALPSNYRYMNTGQGVNYIKVLTESWKYEQTFLSNFHFDAFYSYSQSKNNDIFYDFSFAEPFAYDTSTYDQSIEVVQQIAKNDTANMSVNWYDFFVHKSDEKEKSQGFNFKYDFRLSNFISGNLKIGNKYRTKKRTYNRHHEYGRVGVPGAVSIARQALMNRYDLGDSFLDANKLPLIPFIDNDYDDENFFDGQYSFGAVADIDSMMAFYEFFSENFNRIETQKNGSDIHESVLHHIHQTNSQIYDYSGEEKYDASYIMADIDFGSKLNILSGIRIETNKTTYFSNSSDDHTFSHWIYIGESESHTRKNSYYLPAFFLNYKPKPWLSIRYAKTNTITRPNYTSIIPLTRANGQDGTLDWRNKFLTPGLSKNIDMSISFNEDKLGLITITYFRKDIQDLIYDSGSRIMFADDTANFNLSSNYIDYRILNYTLNNPNDVKLDGWELDYQTRFWYLPGPLSGLVFNANYTRIESEVKYPLTFIEHEFDWSIPGVVKSNIDTTYTDRLLDQPNEIINFSLGYDYKGFSGRLSMLYKDDVFMSTAFWAELRQKTDAYQRWDLSMKQKLPIDGMEMFLNVSNLTETNDVNRYRGETSNGDNLSTEQYYGKTIDLGFRYSF